MNPVLIFVPTYNERENAPKLINDLMSELVTLGLKADFLFMDDGSPDGTGAILDSLALKHAQLRVVHRPHKLGIGSAHQAGIAWAYDHGYKTLITMDCDFTHSTSDLALFLRADPNYPLVIGSRYLQKNSLPGWNLFRKTLTWTGHLLTKNLLGMNYDATGAFRLYRLDRIPKETFQLVRSLGYSFFFESLFVLTQNRFSVVEVSISLPARTYGNSKMTYQEIFNSLRLLFSIFFRKMFQPETYQLRLAAISSSKAEWDHYWREEKHTGGRVYGWIAEFYRRFIIRPSLNRFIRKTFSEGSEILHAGCGSGQVDRDLHRHVEITALDLSPLALKIYARENDHRARTIEGNLFNLPFEPETFDGIYNLGVMEHFSEADIITILSEFRRVLRKNGKIVLFWPPEFGLSVIFFKTLKLVIRVLTGKVVKFHPDEICRIRSRAHAQTILETAGFEMKEFAFGIRDAFTYAVIVAEPKSSSLSV